MQRLRPADRFSCRSPSRLAILAFVPSVWQQAVERWSLLIAAAAISVWDGALFALVQKRERTFALDVALRKQHYIQACA